MERIVLITVERQLSFEGCLLLCVEDNYRICYGGCKIAPCGKDCWFNSNSTHFDTMAELANASDC